MDDKRKRGLGRGLSALLGNTPLATPPTEKTSEPTVVDLKGTVQIPVTHMQSGRYQPRMEFDQEALQDLADSIRAKGIIQPILVRPLPEDPSRYEIIAGERRWRAAQMAQQHEVPVLVRDFNDQEAAEVALIENLQRRDLSPLEEAEGYKRLIDDFSRTQEDLAQALGKSRSHVANMIRLLALPEPVKVYMRDGRLTAGHARALLNAEDPANLAQQVVSKGLNVRQTEKLATDKGGVKARKPKMVKEKDSDTLALERDLARVLGLKVEVEFLGRGGQVVIHYDTLDQLDDILYRLNNPSDRHRATSTNSDAEPSGGYAFDDFEADNAAFAASFSRSSVTLPEPNEAPFASGLDAADSAAEVEELLASMDGGGSLADDAALAFGHDDHDDEPQAPSPRVEIDLSSEDDELDLDTEVDAWAAELSAELVSETAALTADSTSLADDADLDIDEYQSEESPRVEVDLSSESEDDALDLDGATDAWAAELSAETALESAALTTDAESLAGDADLDLAHYQEDEPETALAASSDDAVDLDGSVDAWAAELSAEATSETAELTAEGESQDGDAELDLAHYQDDEDATEPAPASDSDEVSVEDAEAVLKALRDAVEGDDPLAALARMGAFSGAGDEDEDEVDDEALFQASADAWADSLKGTSVGETAASDEELQALLARVKDAENK